MQKEFNRVKVPLFGVIGIVLITFIAFAAVKPTFFKQAGPISSITGNAVADASFFDDAITADAPGARTNDPICGTDGITYRNLCEARKAGVDMKHRGQCPGD